MSAEPALQTPPQPASKQRSLVGPFNRAGAPSILDLGFDAEAAQAGEMEVAEHGNEIVGVPGERVPHVSFGFEGERWRIRNVAWLIAQSKTGVKMLETVYQAGYRICFDAMAFSGERFGSALNLADKVISLDPRANLEKLVLTLAYQLAIATETVNGVVMGLQLNPAAALLTHRLLSANAHATVLQVAFELKTATTLPAKSKREMFWELAASEQPVLAAAFEKAATNAMALDSGLAAAEAIRAFYNSAELRLKAGAEIINIYRALPPAAFKDAKLMLLGFNAEDITYKFKLPGVGYATKHEPKLNLADSRHSGVFPETLEALTLLQTTRRNAGLRDREAWTLPVVQHSEFKE